MEGTGSSTALRPGITGPPANDKTANAKGENRDNSAFETAPADYDDWSYPADSLGLQNAFLLAAAPRIDLIQLAVFGRERIKYNRQIQFTSARQYPAAVPEREYLRASGSAALPPRITALPLRRHAATARQRGVTLRSQRGAHEREHSPLPARQRDGPGPTQIPGNCRHRSGG